MSALSKGDRVWVAHPEDAWIVGRINTINAKAAEVSTDKRGIIKVDLSTSALEPCGDHVDHDIDNLVDLDELSEGAILHHVRKRFTKKVIYTYVGPILVAVNPFEKLPIYEAVDIRQAKSHVQVYPHIFITAAVAFRQLDENKKSQSCLISGESGAGKTETTKKVLTYLAAVAPGVSAAGEAGIEERILMSNPLLEALGNAKTLRNNNSSRFGKYIKLEFSSNLKIRGCEIVNYLLEKSRVVTQSKMERNYHIFYHLCSMSDKKLKEQLRLMSPDSYAYLSSSGCTTIPGVDDQAEFADVQKAMTMLSITEETSINMFKLISAVLLLGNVNFKPSPQADTESVVDPACMKDLGYIADFLQVDVAALQVALVSKNMMVGRENVTVKFNVAQALDGRDTLSKSLYSNMFDYVVQIVNGTLASKEKGAAPFYIGILDIFGFEIFEKNSFEQLCINYANEKLQFHFNSVIFGQEQAMYAAEGVPLENIQFVDNSRCVDLIEGKPYGLIALLEEECSLGGGKDSSYISKVEKAFGKDRQQANVHFTKHKTKPTVFSVIHFAGAVEYIVEGWLDKNRDTMSPTMRQTMQESNMPLISSLFTDGESAAMGQSPTKGGATKSSKSTLGTQFRSQLISLLESLGATEPHFVRCVKPNHAKVGGIIESHLVLNQMRYSGLFEAIRIRKSGYAYRASHEVFAHQYQLLADDVSAKLKKGSITSQQACQKIIDTLVKEGVIASKVAACGNTKIFLKNTADRAVLDRHKRVRTEKFAIKIQGAYRVHAAYVAMNRLKWESQKEQRRIELERQRAWRLALLVQTIVRGKLARNYVAKMQPIVDLRIAVRTRNVALIMTAADIVERCHNGILEGPYGKTFRTEVKSARQLCALIEMQTDFAHKLEIALSENNLEEIQALTNKSHQLDMRQHALVEKAEQRMQRAQQQLHVMKQMVHFLKNSETMSFDPRSLLEEARELEVDEEFVMKVRRVYNTTGPLLSAKFGIRKAVEYVDKIAITRALEDVRALQAFHPNFCSEEVAAAQQMLKMLHFQQQFVGTRNSTTINRSRTASAEPGDSEEKESNASVKPEEMSDDGPRLTPTTLDLCEIICYTDDMNLARKAQSRLSLMTRNTEDMEELVRCFKWSKLFCTWKYPENMEREAKEAGTTKELLARRRTVAMGLLGVDDESSDNILMDPSADGKGVPEFDFFGLRAEEARTGSYLKKMLTPVIVDITDANTEKSPIKPERVSSTISDNTELPEGVSEMMKKLEKLTSKKNPKDSEKSGSGAKESVVPGAIHAKGMFASAAFKSSRAAKQQSLLQQMSERTQAGAKLRKEMTRAAFEADRTSTLVPPSPTRVLQPAAVKPLPKTNYVQLSASQEAKLLASRKAAEKQEKVKRKAFAHLEKESVHRFKL